jgi:hypothetical protein
MGKSACLEERQRSVSFIYAYIRTFKSSAPDLQGYSCLNAIVDAAKQEKK